MIKSSLLAAALVLPMAGAALAETYVIDTAGAHASINFKASHLGYSILTGRFDTFSGSFEFDPTNPEAASVSVEIDATSVNSNHAERDNHLRSADFLNVATYPTASFVSTGITTTGDNTAVITGDFTLMGVTKSVDIETTHIGGGDDPWGGYRHGFSGTLTIIPADYGMPGGIAKAPLALELEVEGIRQ